MSQEDSIATVQRIDHARQLVSQLKESLNNLMKLAAQCISPTGKTSDGKTNSASLEKNLEDFCSILNQIERCLTTIIECAIQQKDSAKYIPFVVSRALDTTGAIEVPPGEKISYQQFLTVAKSQVDHFLAIEGLLRDFRIQSTSNEKS